jgi:CBS domain-containing protein
MICRMTDGQDPIARVTGPDAPITTYTSEEIVTLPPMATIRQAAAMMDGAGVGCVVIGSADAVDGVVTERDVVRVLAAGLDPDQATVADIESRVLQWAGPDATVGDVAEEMMESYVRHVLIGENGHLRGVVSMRDLITAYLS